MRRLVTIAVAAFAIATSAAIAAEWQSVIAPADAARLAAIDEAWTKARAEAQGGDAAELKIADDLHAGRPQAVGDITGTWQCRTVKVGGGFSPIISYGWFKCRISQKSGGLFLEKVTGSQRTSGYLFADGADAMVYLGSWYVQGEQPGIYAQGGELLGSEAVQTNHPGRLTRIGGNRLRIEFPYPALESTFDFLELKR